LVAGGWWLAAVGVRLHLEEHIFELSRLIAAHQALRVGFDLIF